MTITNEQKKLLLGIGFVALAVYIVSSFNTASNTKAVNNIKNDELTPPAPSPSQPLGIRVGEPVGQAQSNIARVDVQQATIAPVMVDSKFPIADDVIYAGPTIVK